MRSPRLYLGLSFGVSWKLLILLGTAGYLAVGYCIEHWDTLLPALVNINP